MEIVIVDDCSTDDSLIVAHELKSLYQCITIIEHSTNLGHIATYNDGLAAVAGEFVVLLSADDMVTKGSLTRAAALLAAEEEVGLVYGNAIHFTEEPPWSRSQGDKWIVWKGSDWLRGRCAIGYNVVASPEVMMRTSVLRSIGGYRPDLPHAGDFEMWLRTSTVSDVGFLPSVDQAFYRHHGSNMNTGMFCAGTARGQLIDLQQRLLAFESVFSGVGRKLMDCDQLATMARQTLAKQALGLVNYAYARGFRFFPIEEFVDFALSADYRVKNSAVGRSFKYRQLVGMVSLPLHPLWALSAVWWRLKQKLRDFRGRHVGY